MLRIEIQVADVHKQGLAPKVTLCKGCERRERDRKITVGGVGDGLHDIASEGHGV